MAIGQLQQGRDRLQQGEDAVLWGGIPESVDAPGHAIVHFAITLTYPDGEVILAWTGPGELIFGGNTWQSAPVALAAIGELHDTAEIDDQNRLSVGMFLPYSEVIGEALQDPGVVRGKVEVPASFDDGVTWTFLPRSHEGFVSNARVVWEDVDSGGAAPVYRFEIATLYGDVDRGRPAYWGDETWRSRHNGDKFFANRAQLENGQEFEKWPRRR